MVMDVWCGGWCRYWEVDACVCGGRECARGSVGESFGVLFPGLEEGVVSLLEDEGCLQVVDGVGSEEVESGVVVLVVVPVEELLAEGACVVEGVEGFGEVGGGI
jgi:hypothetical protein